MEDDVKQLTFVCPQCLAFAYPTDLTNEEWELIEPLLPAPKPIGHPREVDYREIVNAHELTCYTKGVDGGAYPMT